MAGTGWGGLVLEAAFLDVLDVDGELFDAVPEAALGDAEELGGSGLDAAGSPQGASDERRSRCFRIMRASSSEHSLSHPYLHDFQIGASLHLAVSTRETTVPFVL